MDGGGSGAGGRQHSSIESSCYLRWGRVLKQDCVWSLSSEVGMMQVKAIHGRADDDASD